MGKKISLLTFLSILPLVACNKSNGTVKVTFDLCNADPNVVIEINKGSKITNQPVANKYGCNFLSYQKDGQDFDFNTAINEDITLKAHYEYNENTLFANRPNPEIRHDNANLRVMSFNMLVSVYDYHPYHHGYNEKNENYPISVDDGRDYQAFETIERYQPDVIGIQECDLEGDSGMPTGDTGWYNAFKTRYTKDSTKFPYKIINENNPQEDAGDGKGKHTLYSTIAYNTNTVNFTNGDYDAQLSEFSDNDNCRWLTWARFSLKSDPNKKFMVTSTHWNLSRTCSEEARIAQARESAYITLGRQAHYSGIPVITTGDYNRDDYSKPYKAFLESSGFKDSKYDATKRGFVNVSYHMGDNSGLPNCEYFRTKGSLLKQNPDRIDTIDHLFLSPKVKCHYYDIISEERALYSSDHMPSYVDVTI